jgi:hypothetical protein
VDAAPVQRPTARPLLPHPPPHTHTHTHTHTYIHTSHLSHAPSSARAYVSIYWRPRVYAMPICVSLYYAPCACWFLWPMCLHASLCVSLCVCLYGGGLPICEYVSACWLLWPTCLYASLSLCVCVCVWCGAVGVRAYHRRAGLRRVHGPALSSRLHPYNADHRLPPRPAHTHTHTHTRTHRHTRTYIHTYTHRHTHTHTHRHTGTRTHTACYASRSKSAL